MEPVVPTDRQIHRHPPPAPRTAPAGCPYGPLPSIPTWQFPASGREPDPMRVKRMSTGAAMAVGALAAASLAFAPSALAVTPQSATITADCGSFGGGEATLTATQDGTAATITVTSSAIT